MKSPARLLLLVCVIVFAIAAEIDATTREGFESPDVSWRLADYDGSAKLILHERDFQSARTGQGCEHARVWAKQGTYAHLAHAVTSAPLIDELVPSVWIKANRPGLQILARVVLPRTKDAEGKPIALLLGGDFYADVSGWQQLRVPQINDLLRSEITRRRLQFPNIDAAEAYLDHIVINGYGGPGLTDIWIDDLEVNGFASVGLQRRGLPIMSSQTPSPNEPRRRRAELRGPLLLADDRPFFARIIEHNGEAFAWLTELGFNTIWLRTPPTESQLTEAQDAGVWLFCAPPLENGVVSVSSLHRQVLAWDAGEAGNEAETSLALQVASLLHRQDPAERPVVSRTSGDATALSGGSDIVMIGRRLFGTSVDLSGYANWLRSEVSERRHQPFWATVQTEPSASLSEQLAIGRNDAPSVAAAPQQIRLAAFESIAAGARGICFRSRTRLDASTPSSTLRAKTLQLINAELSVVAPWAAGGAAKSLAHADPDTHVTALETDRSRMLIAIRHGRNDQYEPAVPADAPISLVAHTARFTDQAYVISPIGLQPLHGSRSGGLHLTLPSPQAVSLVLLTQDALAINRVAQDLAHLRTSLIDLTLEILKMQTQETAQTLDQIGRGDPHAAKSIDDARSATERAEQMLQAGNFKQAWLAIQEAERLVQRIRRATWEVEVRNFPSPASSPLCASFATLPLHRNAARYFASGRWSQNLLPAAGFENLEQMLSSGWRQQRASNDTRDAIVELTPQNPAAGRSALRLGSTAEDGPNRVEAKWSIAIVSPSVSVRSGQVIRIRGWVNIPTRISGSDDGLIIQDSQTGEDLAERIQGTNGWEEFTLYRRCPRDGGVRLYLALTGSGEARLDDLSICVLQ